MAAYAAAVSLGKTLRQLQTTPNYPCSEIVVLLEGVDSLKHFLVDNREVKKEFEIRIRDAIYEAQDITDSHIMSSTHALSPSEVEISNQSFYEELDKVVQKINSLVKMTTSEEFNNQTLDRKINVSVWKDIYEIKLLYSDKIVGRDEIINQLENRLMKGSEELQVVPIVGIAGMGKTTVAQGAYKQQHKFGKHFGTLAWVKVPIEYKKRDVLLIFLRSMQKLGDEINGKTDEELAKYIYNSLKTKRYLVVLDGIRDIETWNDLKELFPKHHNRSRILLTTRSIDLALFTGDPLKLDRLSDEHTFVLLQEIVFREEPCPQEFVVIAKDLAQHCRGLPIAAVIVGRLLACAQLMEEYWEIVLSSIKSMPSLTGDYYVDIVEALVSLTYKHLPQQSKPCILYMAMFPFDYKVPLLKLAGLWVAEEFIEIDNMNTSSLEELETSLGCFGHLHHRYLISYDAMVEQGMEFSTFNDEVFHDFFRRTAKEENFYFVINKDTNCGDSLQEAPITYNQQRRLFIRTNIVPFIHNYHTEVSISKIGSFLYYGPEHQCPLSAWLEFKVLKIMDTVKLRFYSFPPEILKLIQLKYLTLSYNGNLPGAVCKLYNLQFLIVLRYHSVKSSGAPSYLPSDIWNMRALRELEVMGSDLPKPPSNTNLNLENLLQLSGVSSHSCSREILKRITNIWQLRVQIESLPEDKSLNFFSYLQILNNLLQFDCVVKYPNIGSQVVPCVVPAFPSTLAILNLDGCGFPIESMSVIAALPNLVNLNLQNYAFQGPKWKVKKDEFPKLIVLVLVDMDLKNWIIEDQSCFPTIQELIIKHCYKLHGVPYEIGDIPTLEVLEVVDCSTSAMNLALEMKEKLCRRDNFQFNVYSSRDD